MYPSRVLFQLAGSIACYKACQAIRALMKQGCEVQPVATRSALEFIGEATLEGLTGKRVYSDVFESGTMMSHIDLAKWCNVMVLCPATADTLARLAGGRADDLITALYLARRENTRYLICPAMNGNMWRHPATQQNVKTLEEWGCEFVHPGEGYLACGDTDQGRLAEPEEIVAAIQIRSSGKTVLITAGGTQEPIDAVRFISNKSTGATGAAIADACANAGHEVLYVHAKDAILPHAPVQTFPFATVQDLQKALRTATQDKVVDRVIHAAAVSDFKIKDASESKLSSDDGQHLDLVPTPKVIDELRELVGDKCEIVAFKLTAHASESTIQESINALEQRTHPDWVVHNDIDEIAEDSHRTHIYRKGKLELENETKEDLANALARFPLGGLT